MRIKTYIRVAKRARGFKIEASDKPNYRPIQSGTKYLPTVQFILNLDILDAEFDASRIALDAVIRNTNPAVEVNQTEDYV
jgi:hypothetical protein